MLRSKARWHEDGEKSTKYFYSLEKRNQVRKQIGKLQLADGKTITDSKSILQESRDFDQRLYNSSSTKSDSIQDEIFLENVPKLSKEEKMSCEGLLRGCLCNFRPLDPGQVYDFL